MKRNYWGLWLSGLAILLSACEKDLPEGESATAVPVIFSISNEDFGANEQVLRDAKTIKPKTVTIPLNDTYYLRATLRPDTVADLRGDELRASLKDGQRVQFYAFKVNSGTHQSTATYTYSSGTGNLTSGSPLKVEPDGTNYRFVAFSYFADNYKGNSPDTYIYPYCDLVCGYRDQAITNSIAGRKVGLINMEHKFSQVRVKIDASEVANSILDYPRSVIIYGGDRAYFSSVFNRTITRQNGGDISQWLSFNGTSSVLTSDYCVHYPAVSSVEIRDLTLSLKIGGTHTISNLTLDFDVPLSPNTNYTLVVDIREVPYARSNIYWDGSRLWFDKTDQGNEDYNGVHFKWGSLVGISPTYTILENTTLYIPDNISSRTWDDTKTIGTSAFGSWAGIEEGSMSDDFSHYKGDICKYIDSDWKMPDLPVVGQYIYDGFEARSFGLADYGYLEGGVNHMGDAGVFHSLYGTFLPVAGYRDAYGEVREVIQTGHYWKNDGGKLYFLSGYIFSTSATSGEAYAVRCIKANF
jgi:hypothetical protein